MQIHLKVMAVEPYQQGCQCCMVPECIIAKGDSHTLDPGSTSYSCMLMGKLFHISEPLFP